MNNLCMVFIIISDNDEKKLMSIINKYKIVTKIMVCGSGTASSSVLDYLGLVKDEKLIINAVIPMVVSKCLFKDLEDNFMVNEYGRGIAFSIPLSSSAKYMMDFYKDCKAEDIEMEKANQHLIVTIVNSGQAEKVMEEARKAGATGGTALSGRGLGSEEVIRFLKLAIEPEKDIVLILIPDDKKNDVMNAILKNCGLKTPGAGICFSLPVDYVVGINHNLKIK